MSARSRRDEHQVGLDDQITIEHDVHRRDQHLAEIAGVGMGLECPRQAKHHPLMVDEGRIGDPHHTADQFLRQHRLRRLLVFPEGHTGLSVGWPSRV